MAFHFEVTNKAKKLDTAPVVSVRLFPEQIQKLESLMQSTGVKTRGEMIRRLIEEKDFNPAIREGAKK